MLRRHFRELVVAHDAGSVEPRVDQEDGERSTVPTKRELERPPVFGSRQLRPPLQGE